MIVAGLEGNAQIVRLLSGRVADYKLPEQLVLCDEIPMTPCGKIRRGELMKRLVAEGRGMR